MQRTRQLAIGVIVVIALIAGAFWLGRQTQSVESPTLPAAPPAPTSVPDAAEPVATQSPPAALEPDTSVSEVRYYAFPVVHPNVSAVEALAEEFNRSQQNVVIEVSTEVAASPPITIETVSAEYDCFTWVSGFDPGAQVYSLDSLIDADPNGAQLLNDFYPGLSDLFRSDGQLFGLPLATQPLMIYYDATRLQELELTPPNTDWTLDDFIALASATSIGEGDEHVYGFVPITPIAIDFLLAARDVTLVDFSSSPPTVLLDDSTTLGFLDWLSGLSNAGVIAAYDEGGTRTLQGNAQQRSIYIATGRAVMWTALSGTGESFSGDQGLDVRIAPLPQVPGNLPSPLVRGLYISRRMADPSACWGWLKFLTEHPAVFNGAPARRSVAESVEWESIVGSDAAAALRAALSRSTQNFADSRWSYGTSFALSAPINKWFEDALAAALEGEDPAALLAQKQQYADDYLACLATSGEITTLRNDDATFAQVDACAKQADPQFSNDADLLGG